MDERLKAICRRAGLREIGWQVLRHSFCSHLAMLGVAAQTVQRLAGHSSLSITERYTHLSPEHAATAIGTLDRRQIHGTLTAHSTTPSENPHQSP